MTRKTASKKAAPVAGLLGVGLDHTDGHQRITRGDDFLLMGGSQETHERMQDVAIHVTEGLQKKGTRLPDADPREVLDLLRRALER